jgi:hypothetical protein
VRVWLQRHGDIADGQQPTLLVEAGAVDRAIADMTQLQFGGGGDPDEDHLAGIEHLTEIIRWAVSRTHRVAVMFATAGSKPSPSGKSATEIGRTLCDPVCPLCYPLPQKAQAA